MQLSTDGLLREHKVGFTVNSYNFNICKWRWLASLFIFTGIVYNWVMLSCSFGRLPGIIQTLMRSHSSYGFYKCCICEGNRLCTQILSGSDSEPVSHRLLQISLSTREFPSTYKDHNHSSSCKCFLLFITLYYRKHFIHFWAHLILFKNLTLSENTGYSKSPYTDFKKKSIYPLILNYISHKRDCVT